MVNKCLAFNFITRSLDFCIPSSQSLQILLIDNSWSGGTLWLLSLIWWLVFDWFQTFCQLPLECLPAVCTDPPGLGLAISPLTRHNNKMSFYRFVTTCCLTFIAQPFSFNITTNSKSRFYPHFAWEIIKLRILDENLQAHLACSQWHLKVL